MYDNDAHLCCACTKVGTARVIDRGFVKLVCEQHARKYAREGYQVLPKN